jgi:hypothetical protein
MGVAIRDVDGDLDLDIVVTNYQDEYNALYRNEGKLHFTDSSFVAGVGQGTGQTVNFGVLLEDFDNDSWPDLSVMTGHVYPLADQIPSLHGYAQKKFYYHNDGTGRFVNVSDRSGPASSLKSVARGSAAADFDHDGDIDMIVNNLDGAPFFLENRSPAGNWLQIAIQDERGMPAYGARVWIAAKSRKQVAELHSSDSFLSQSSATLHFGLGKDEKVDQIQIRWPDGTEKELKEIKANQRIRVKKELHQR